MKKHFFLLSVTGFACFMIFCLISQTKNDAVNPLLGDISYVKKFGKQPTSTVDEDLRISTHLEYVEELLRQKETTHLTPELKEKRFRLLDLLHEYRLAGMYPRNFEHPEARTPCFIDREGRICAVGYLVEQTAGRKTAEQINSRFQYEKLLAMKDKTIDNWIATSGLTKKECAMIQPTYYYEDPNNNIPTGYGIATAVLGGINLSLSAINATQMNSGKAKSAAPVIGLFTGGGSLITGIYMLSISNNRLYQPYPNESKKALSLVNIGLGTSTLILSICNYATNRPKSDKAVSWNVYSIPAADKKVGVGFSLSKRL